MPHAGPIFLIAMISATLGTLARGPLGTVHVCLIHGHESHQSYNCVLVLKWHL
jgi:hypothetical protein